MNDLDRAISDMKRGPSAQPELYRRLSEGELWTIIPRRPAIEEVQFDFSQETELPLVALPHGKRKVIAVYSSEERLMEGLSRGKAPPETYAALAVPANVLLEAISRAGLDAAVNYFCQTTGQVIVPPDILRGLADGSALKPAKVTGKRPEVREWLKVVSPADYPTRMLQPLFELFKQDRSFRAAWIFEVPKTAPTTESGRHFKVLVLMDPRNDAIYHDVEVVLDAVPKDGNVISGGLLNEKDRRAIERTFGVAEPFFMAVDYERPAGKTK